MKRVERPKIQELSTGDQFYLIDMPEFEVIEGKNEPSSIRFVVADTEMNKRVYDYVETRNLLVFEGQYYILLVDGQDELGFKDCDAIQLGAELTRQTQEKKITGYLSIEEGLKHIFEGSNFKYVNRCSKHNQLQFENFGGVNRMGMIQNLLNRFDIECIFDNMTVIFADRIGKTTDKLYKFGYNVNAIKKTTDDSNCSFSVLLLGHTPTEEEGGGEQFTYYYESPLKYKMPELIRNRQAENIEDDKIKDKETAKRRCEEIVNDIPVVSITVDHKEADFDDSSEPKVGDKAILQHHKYNMDFDVRVVKRTRYPFEETPNNYEFSNKRDELVDRTEEQKKWTSDILSVVKELDKNLLEESNNYTDRINAITDKKAEEAKQESEAAKELAELVKENQKNFQTTIIESNTAPTQNLEPGKSLWLDTSKGKPGILKKWNGKTWDPIVPDVESAIKISEEQTNKEIQQIISDMQDKADTEWLNTQLEGKADKSGVFTKEEIKDGFVGKQTYETDKEGNIKKFQEISTTFEQTNEAIKSKAETQSVTDLGNNLSQVSKVASEAKQTSEGNTRIISNIQTTVDEQKTSIGNLSKKTTEIEEKAGQITEKLTSVEQRKSGIRNLITGTAFENANGWKQWGNVGRVGVYGPMGTAKQCLYIETKSADGKTNLVVPQGTAIGLQGNGHTFSVKAGQEYTLSMQVATSELGDTLNYIYLMYSVTGGNRRLPTIKITDFLKSEPIYVGATTYYYKVSFTFKADRDDSNVHLLIGGLTVKELTGSNGYAWIRIYELKVETGNMPTEWTPATEDQVSQIVFEQKTAEFTRTTDSIKQSVESISKTQTTQGEQLEQAKSTLETQAKSIEGKVGIKQVEDYVSGIGYTNEILNSRLLKDKKNWTGSGAGLVWNADTNKICNGNYSMYMKVTGETSNTYKNVTSNRVAVSPGEIMTASAYFYTTNIAEHQTSKLEMNIIFWNKSGVQLTATANFFGIPNNTWTRNVFTLVAPADAVECAVRFYIIRNGEYWFSQPMLQRGEIASSFVENPNDIVGKDQIMSDLAEKVATADYNKKITEIDNRFTVNEKGIELAAKKTEVYTQTESDGRYAKGAYVKEMEARISVTEKDILSTVKVGNVISSINQTAEKIQIEAKRINLVGAVTAESIAGKLLEGITIRAKDPNDNNNFTEMSNGRIFTQGPQTPAEWNQWSKKVITGLEKGLFYSRGYKEDGSQANSVDIAAWGATFNNGNDTATYGSQTFTILDKGARKSVTARSYDATQGWRPSLSLDNPQNAELANIRSDAIYFYNFNKNYKNEWVTENGGSHLTLYKSMLACDDGWWGYLQVKNGSGSSHSGVVATEYKTTSQQKLKTYIKDLQFDALQDVLDLKIKEYYFKSDVATLYEMREQKEEGQPPYTLNDIPKYYGFMVDDCPLAFTDAERQGINLYASLSVLIKGFQEYVAKTDERLNQLEGERLNPL
ncbi:hypothetical protein COE51_06450 [Bacillus pseudomycoides]|nr:hypothetical protein COE51_06450 [Bacillus pseudomycoides]